MRTERVPSPVTPAVFRVYLSFLPRWLCRFQVSASDADDVMQEVLLAIHRGTVQLPSDAQEARLELFKATRKAAKKVRRRKMRDAHRLRVPILESLVSFTAAWPAASCPPLHGS